MGSLRCGHAEVALNEDNPDLGLLYLMKAVIHELQPFSYRKPIAVALCSIFF